jgi:hypothetical protein
MGLTKTQRICAGAAFAVVVVGSIGPWATLGVFSKAGTDGDGILTLIAALVVTVQVAGNQGSRAASAVSASMMGCWFLRAVLR